MWVTVKAIKGLDNKTCWCTLQERLCEYLYAPMVLWWSHYSSFLCLVFTLLVLVLRLMPNAARVSVLSILDCPSVFSDVCFILQGLIFNSFKSNLKKRKVQSKTVNRRETNNTKLKKKSNSDPPNNTKINHRPSSTTCVWFYCLYILLSYFGSLTFWLWTCMMNELQKRIV